MIRYFFGDDIVTARGRISDIAKEQQASIRFVDKEDLQSLSLQELMDSSHNSLFGKTMLVLRDVSTFPEEFRSQIVALAESESANGEVIAWDRLTPDARLTFTKKMKTTTGSESFFQPKDERAMVVWAQEYSAKSGGDVQLSPAILAEIVRRATNDVSAVANEIAKCSVLPSVTVEDIRRIVPERGEQDTSAFPLLEAIIAKRTKDAVRILGTLINGGSSERFILSMLAYQYRLFLAVRIGREKGADASIIHRATGFHPIAIQKAMPAVSRTSLSAITEALLRIGATEKSISTSSMDPRSMVTMLVVSLSK